MLRRPFVLNVKLVNTVTVTVMLVLLMQMSGYSVGALIRFITNPTFEPQAINNVIGFFLFLGLLIMFTGLAIIIINLLKEVIGDIIWRIHHGKHQNQKGYSE